MSGEDAVLPFGDESMTAAKMPDARFTHADADTSCWPTDLLAAREEYLTALSGDVHLGRYPVEVVVTASKYALALEEHLSNLHRLTFGWDEDTDGVGVLHDGTRAWRGRSFDSLDQYMRLKAPLGVPVILEWSEDIGASDNDTPPATWPGPNVEVSGSDARSSEADHA